MRIAARLLFLLLLPWIAISAPATAQTGAQEVAIALDLAPGSVRNLAILSERQRFKNGALTFTGRTQARIRLTVLERSAAGYRLEWRIEEVSTQGFQGVQAALLDAMARVSEGERIEFATDPSGGVTGLLNPEEVAAFYGRAIETLLGAMAEAGAPAETLNGLRAAAGALTAPARIQEQSLKKPGLLLFFAGSSLEPEATYEYEDSLPLPGGGALPAVGRFTLTEFDPAAGSAKILWQQYPDPERSAEAIRQQLEALAAASGQRLPADFDLSQVVIEDRADYQIDLATGLPSLMTHSRQSAIMNSGQIERTEIRLLP